ncbi:MAG: metallophosphoesterase [Gemmatimonadaceae bacterium]
MSRRAGQSNHRAINWALNGGIAIVLLGVACKPAERDTPPPANATPFEVARSGAARLIGVGDIGVCGAPGDEATARLADSVVKADTSRKIETAVFTLGDNAYPAGLDRDFVECFSSSWGDSSKSLMSLVRPAIGNHDYQSSHGAAYYRYFGARAGPAFRGYYSYDIGDWHAVVLNSELLMNESAAEVEKQAEWLARDLAAHPKRCTLAYFHRPRFSSGAHGSNRRMQSFWTALYRQGVDLVLNGHEHHYERFKPQTSAGTADSVNGMTEIIAGTGGGSLTGIRSTLAPNSAAQIQGHFGILVVLLSADEYRTAFIDTSGRVWDASGGKCH